MEPVPSSDARSAVDASAVLDALPLPALLVDDAAVVRFANSA